MIPLLKLFKAVKIKTNLEKTIKNSFLFPPENYTVKELLNFIPEILERNI